MQQIRLVLEFSGQATPANIDGSLMELEGEAPSAAFQTLLDEDGISSSMTPLDEGGVVHFEAEVKLSPDNSYEESGIVDFGGGDRLIISTALEGTIDDSADAELQHGASVLEIDRGEGAFEDATGRVTSNITVNEVGEYTDTLIIVLFMND